MYPDEVCCWTAVGWERQSIDFNKLQLFIQSLPNKEYIRNLSIESYWISISYNENAVR